MKTSRKFLLSLLCIGSLLSTSVLAGSRGVIGNWYAYEKGLDAVIVKLFKKKKRLYGVITHLYGDFPAKCTSCKGVARNKKIVGMHLLDGLTYHDGKWQGKLLYPAKGAWYDCTLWQQGSQLKVRVCRYGKCNTLTRRRF